MWPFSKPKCLAEKVMVAEAYNETFPSNKPRRVSLMYTCKRQRRHEGPHRAPSPDNWRQDGLAHEWTDDV